MHGTYNGMVASEIQEAVWRKSSHSNSQGTCVELARLPHGEVAVRNSRFPDGPALLCTRAQMAALLQGVKAGDFDGLLVANR